MGQEISKVVFVISSDPEDWIKLGPAKRFWSFSRAGCALSASIEGANLVLVQSSKAFLEDFRRLPAPCKALVAFHRNEPQDPPERSEVVHVQMFSHMSSLDAVWRVLEQLVKAMTGATPADDPLLFPAFQKLEELIENSPGRFRASACRLLGKLWTGADPQEGEVDTEISECLANCSDTERVGELEVGYRVLALMIEEQGIDTDLLRDFRDLLLGPDSESPPDRTGK